MQNAAESAVREHRNAVLFQQGGEAGCCDRQQRVVGFGMHHDKHGFRAVDAFNHGFCFFERHSHAGCGECVGVHAVGSDYGH